jgi:hypothetical protein
MTVKDSRFLIASIVLCTVVGAALAQQSTQGEQPGQQPSPDFPFGSGSRTAAGPVMAPSGASGTDRSQPPQAIPTVTIPSRSDSIDNAGPSDGKLSDDERKLADMAQQLAGHSAGPSDGKLSREERKLADMVQQLAGKIPGTMSAPDRDRIKDDLRELLEKQFELRQRRHEQEIEALEAQVKSLKELVRKRNDNRGLIVSKRLDQILRDAEGLGW